MILLTISNGYYEPQLKSITWVCLSASLALSARQLSGNSAGAGRGSALQAARIISSQQSSANKQRLFKNSSSVPSPYQGDK